MRGPHGPLSMRISASCCPHKRYHILISGLVAPYVPPFAGPTYDPSTQPGVDRWPHTHRYLTPLLLSGDLPLVEGHQALLAIVNSLCD